MKKANVFFVLLLLACTIATAIYSCSKEDNSRENNEMTLYEANTEDIQNENKTFFLGGNIKKVSSISYDNPDLNDLKQSGEWNEIVSKCNLDLTDIKKTYLINSSLSLVTIPILEKNKSTRGYFNIYLRNEKYLITKISETANSSGLTTYKIKSPKDTLYYQFDLNNKNQIGNWFFGKNLPLSEVFNGYAMSQQKVDPNKPCASQPFNDCMNCFIIDVCGSDWMCTVTCGLFIPSCIGGAAAACIILD